MNRRFTCKKYSTRYCTRTLQGNKLKTRVVLVFTLCTIELMQRCQYLYLTRLPYIWHFANDTQPVRCLRRAKLVYNSGSILPIQYVHGRKTFSILDIHVIFTSLFSC